MSQTIKNQLAMQETWVQSLGWEDPLKEGMTTPFSILAWRKPLYRTAWWVTVTGSQRVRHNWATMHTAHTYIILLTYVYYIITIIQIDIWFYYLNLTFSFFYWNYICYEFGFSRWPFFIALEILKVCGREATLKIQYLFPSSRKKSEV